MVYIGIIHGLHCLTIIILLSLCGMALVCGSITESGNRTRSIKYYLLLLLVPRCRDKRKEKISSLHRGWSYEPRTWIKGRSLLFYRPMAYEV